MVAYYNDVDPVAAAALRQLVADGVIAPGEVDTRSIKDVQASDLTGFTQCHFFAGGGGWSIAARIAGWPDGRQLWTGSCPCQPFSVAGQRAGKDDPRHLWPDFHRLICAGRPAVVMGEQVAGKAGYDWFDGVRADLASSGYAGRSVDIPACAVDAPHQRQRLYWLAVADAKGERGRGEFAEWGSQGRAADGRIDARDSAYVVNATGDGRGEGRPEHEFWRGRAAASGADVQDGALADANGAGFGRRPVPGPVKGSGADQQWSCGQSRRPDGGRNGSWWSDGEFIACHDGKARRTKPGLPMLVNGLLGRVDAWRLVGNSIVPILAAEVIAAYLDAERA